MALVPTPTGMPFNRPITGFAQLVCAGMLYVLYASRWSVVIQ
jgi:hypothetical protein